MKINDELKLSTMVVEFILTYPNKDFGNLTIRRILSKFGISRSNLFKQFKTGNNFTLQEFINQQKIFRSAILLLDDTKALSINKIAEMMGYCNSEYYIRVFKKYFGTTPGRYRVLLKSRGNNK